VRVAQQKLRILRVFVGLAIACLSLMVGADNAAAVPKLKVLDASANESAAALRFTVRMSGHTERPVRVSYATVSGSATAGADFTMVMGQIAFQPETKKRTIVVNILPDEIVEGKETLAVKLWKPLWATIARGRATGTIRDDDLPPPSMVHYAGFTPPLPAL
jgi:chitinase